VSLRAFRGNVLHVTFHAPAADADDTITQAFDLGGGMLLPFGDCGAHRGRGCKEQPRELLQAML
jgi:hypothetical protein